MPPTALCTPRTHFIPLSQLKPNGFSVSIYGDPSAEVSDLLPSIREHGILVALVVAPGTEPETWDVISGHRRLACAQALNLTEVPCAIRRLPEGAARHRMILAYNRQRHKTFSQLMREADALEELWSAEANSRRLGNLRRGKVPGAEAAENADRRKPDDRYAFNASDSPEGSGRQPASRGRTDCAIGRELQMGGKDLYRQARAIWRMGQSGDVRAVSSIAQLDDGTKTIHAAYKDLRRRNRFSSDFRPTPYDVWSFRHDRAFGIPHPGTIPASIVAHALYYFTPVDGLVVDPMAGGGTTVDVCQAMGRRCLAYDLHPTRPDIYYHDIRHGLPTQGAGCDLVFCDPPYHTMLARQYASDAISNTPLLGWIAFLHHLARSAFETLRPGGHLALLLAAQTEKDLPAGYGYLDHAFLGYMATLHAGFVPERRISCPMGGAYLPQDVRRARSEGRLLGQVRDLLVVRKPARPMDSHAETFLFMHDRPGDRKSAGLGAL
jgi:ParB family chromosome partitioning protein